MLKTRILKNRRQAWKPTGIDETVFAPYNARRITLRPGGAPSPAFFTAEHIMRRLLIGLLLVLAGFEALAEKGSVSAYQTSGDWSSFQIEFFDNALGRSTVTCAQNADVLFFVDFNARGEPTVWLQQSSLAREVLPQWQSNPVEAPMLVQMRVDYNEIFKVSTVRYLNKPDDLAWHFQNLPTSSLLAQIKAGKNLRIKWSNGRNDFVYTFPLSGASAAISRAKALAGSTPGRIEKPKTEDELFF